MLKFGIILLGLSVALAFPVQNGMFYYQASPYYNPYQNAMYVQYRSQAVPSGVSSYTVGKTIRTNSYVKDAEYFGRQNTISAVAEAYPEAAEDAGQSSNDSPSAADEPHHIPDIAVQDPAVEEIEPEFDVPEEPAVPLAPTLPAITKKKTKVEVQLDDDEHDDHLSRRSGSGGTTSYFPISIGNPYHGAIAIANAFSNGKGGAAVSRATAYGNSKKEDQDSRKAAKSH